MAIDPVLVVDIVTIRALIAFFLMLLRALSDFYALLTTYARTALTRGNPRSAIFSWCWYTGSTFSKGHVHFLQHEQMYDLLIKRGFQQQTERTIQLLERPDGARG